MAVPSVTTGAAEDIVYRRADLNLTANPNALATTGYCELWDAGWEESGWPYRENYIQNPTGKAGNTKWTAAKGIEAVKFSDFGVPDIALPSGEIVEYGFRVTDSCKGYATIIGPFPHLTLSAYGFSRTEGAQIWNLIFNEKGLGLGGTKNNLPFEEWKLMEDSVLTEHFFQTEWRRTSGMEVEWFIAVPMMEVATSRGVAFPTPAQLESGQAVFTGTENASASRLATPTYVPASKDLDAGEGEDPVALSTTATVLTPSTTYKYRAVGENEDGEGSGEVEEFTTKDLPDSSESYGISGNSYSFPDASSYATV